MNVSQSKFRPLVFLAAVALGAILISAVVAVDVDAARSAGGKGKGKPGPTPVPTGTCVATPSTAAQWDIVTITGSGFPASTTVSFSYNGSAGWVTTDISGGFSRDVQAYLMGTNTVVVDGSATCTFEAV